MIFIDCFIHCKRDCCSVFCNQQVAGSIPVPSSSIYAVFIVCENRFFIDKVIYKVITTKKKSDFLIGLLFCTDTLVFFLMIFAYFF